MDTPPSPSKSKQKRGGTKKKKKQKSLDSDPGELVGVGGGSPLHGARRAVAPPLPPERRRTQPEFMKQLEAEMAERRHKERGVSLGEKDMPTTTQAEERAEKGEGSNDDNTTPSSATPPATTAEEGSGVRTQASPMRTRASLKPRTRPAPMPPPSSHAAATPTAGDGQGEGEGVELDKAQARVEIGEKEGTITAALKEQAGHKLGR